jgi:hypothetical protein
MPLYTFIHSLLNVLVQIANKMELRRQFDCVAEDSDPASVSALSNVESLLVESSRV